MAKGKKQNTEPRPPADVSASGLDLDRRNANLGTERGRGMLEKSLRQLGAGRGILADSNNVVIAGNKTLEVAAELGIPVQIVETDGRTLVVTKRTDIALDDPNDPTARQLAYADNIVAREDLAIDPVRVAEDLAAGLDLRMWFDRDELARFGEKLGGGGEGDGDDIPEEVETRCKLGQLWAMGDHRLLCADATVPANIARVMGGEGEKADMVWTDPPWNVAVGQQSNPRWRQRDKGLQNDDMSADDFQKFLEGFVNAIKGRCLGDLYCVLGSSEWPRIDGVLRVAGYHWSATVIWVKDRFVLGRSKYHRRYEPIWYGWHESVKSSFSGERDVDDVWEVPRPAKSDEHPTMKPVELVARAIRHSSKPGDVVLDPFLGAGSAVIACEFGGRKCRGTEIEPGFCDVILARWEAFTGRKAELLEDAPGGETDV